MLTMQLSLVFAEDETYLFFRKSPKREPPSSYMKQCNKWKTVYILMNEFLWNE